MKQKWLPLLLADEVCYECGEKGHYEKNCPDKEEEEKPKEAKREKRKEILHFKWLIAFIKKKLKQKIGTIIVRNTYAL